MRTTSAIGTTERNIKTGTIEFPNAQVDVSVQDEVVYCYVSGVFTDDVALSMTRYLDKLIDASASGLARVWDASGIPAGSFQLTAGCLESLADWARRVKTRRPGSVAYMVGSTPIAYGMGRMYETRTGLEETGVFVVRTLDDLPLAIRQKVPG